jgi:hypothetical protein
MSDLVERLRLCAEDPMWDAHAEVSKALLTNAADRIQTLEAVLKYYDECSVHARRAALDKDAGK